ncbi:hypothetical protein RJ641_006505 [Dillenia turbinata]|uniref:Uncharacterized protein n=1 Tax=Dillenia turbinata TaxID=194707 RepID=A0AAN8Z656_9MAGN
MNPNLKPLHINGLQQKTEETTNTFWQWSPNNTSKKNKEAKPFSIPKLFADKRRKSEPVILGPGGGIGIGCGVGLGFGLVGGLGYLPGSPWNHIHVAFGIGLGCGVGVGFGYGHGMGYGFPLESLESYSFPSPNADSDHLIVIKI